MENGDSLYARIAELEKKIEKLKEERYRDWDIYPSGSDEESEEEFDSDEESDEEFDSDEESDEDEDEDKVNASLRAQQYCRDNGLDITKVTGSGVEGKVLLKDVFDYEVAYEVASSMKPFLD